MKIRAKLITMAGVAAILTGCILTNQGTVSGSDMASFQKVFMSSYYAERGGTPAGARGLTPFLPIAHAGQGAGGKATVPVGGLTDAHFASLAPTTFVGYPEPDETTSFTISTKDAANHVYDITATTTYPSTEIRKNYVEEYYVMDGNPSYSLGPDGIWTIDDPIVKLSGSTWVQDQKARVQQVLTFTDGTTRNETIVAQTDFTTHLPRFDSFPVTDPASSPADYDIGSTFYPHTPPTSGNILFSSVVMYYVTPSTNANYWFWQGTQGKTILGIRYYTEDWGINTAGGTFTSTTVSFEKTVDTLTTTGGSYAQTLKTVFAGSQFNTLAETVLRQRVTYTELGPNQLDLTSGTKLTYMQSRVVDITAQKDFYLQQLDSDNVSLSTWSTTTIYTPTGAVSEVLASNPPAFVYSRTATTSVGGNLPLAVPSNQVDNTGTGDLAILYSSIQEGNGITPTGSAIPGSIQPPNVEWTYNGAQGSTLPSTTVPPLGNTGTVEAWVYINQQTDTGGIVHKGVSPTFNDEAWSLQFWYGQGQIAWVIDQPGSSGSSYDLLLSTINLNTNKWYYIVATWDATANPKYINLYINGTLNNSRLPSWTPSEADPNNTSAVIVGSQLPTTYDATYGYFGFNGKINGVRVTSTPMSATTVASNYAAYVLQTANW